MKNEKRNSQNKVASTFLPSNQVYARLQESIKKRLLDSTLAKISKLLRENGVPYGSRTRVAAVKEKGPVVIQRNLAAWIALYRT